MGQDVRRRHSFLAGHDRGSTRRNSSRLAWQKWVHHWHNATLRGLISPQHSVRAHSIHFLAHQVLKATLEIVTDINVPASQSRRLTGAAEAKSPGCPDRPTELSHTGRLWRLLAQVPLPFSWKDCPRPRIERAMSPPPLTHALPSKGRQRHATHYYGNLAVML